LTGVATAAARSDLVGFLSVLFAAACWGTSGIFVTLIAADIEVSALALAFWRDITTFVVLLIGIELLRPTWLQVRRRDLWWLMALGGNLAFSTSFGAWAYSSVGLP
jgi:drug/metabolite transporter (DMT)-like permease